MDRDISDQPYKVFAKPIIDVDDEYVVPDQENVKLKDSKDVLANSALEKHSHQTVHPFDLNSDPEHEQEQLIPGNITAIIFSFITIFVSKNP